MSRVGIIGAGSWGTALSLVLANNGHSVEIWSIVESEIEMLKEKHEHIDKLPGVKLPDSITFTTDIEETIKNNDTCTCGTFCIHQKHSSKNGSVCEGRTDNCLCGKGN